MFSSNTSQVSSDANYIEDVFSTWLYTGNGSTQTINNGIDLAGKGGLVWIKSRSANTNNWLFDTVRGALNEINSNTADGQASLASSLTAFNANGFSVGLAAGINTNSALYTSWTLREQPKFFDVQTWTGTGLSRTISHNLGSIPGCIMVKRTDVGSGEDWQVYHRSLNYAGGTAAQSRIVLNTTAAQTEATFGDWDRTAPTSTVFYLGGNDGVNASGGTYVAYLFAHDAGGFGLTGTDNVISCGSYTGNGSATGPTITLGYEPQWLMIKNVTTGANWRMFDNMRGMPVAANATASLVANATTSESAVQYISATATGFQVVTTSSEVNNSGNVYIYIAIRRGPMKTPTTGTSVFAPVKYTGTNVDNRLVDTGIVTDMTMARIIDITSAGGFYTADRLRGSAFLGTAVTDAEATDADSFMTPTVGYGNSFSAMNGFGVGNDAIRQLNQASTNQLAYAFKRAPGFFDEVCYTGTGILGQTFSHNLGVIPEMMIMKIRSSGFVRGWNVRSPTSTPTNDIIVQLNTTSAATDEPLWNDVGPTSTVFTVSGDPNVNANGQTYVAYLFASCPGVSKVGSYTGTGATQVINCGFTGGARFVLIKRTDAAGDWYVWDTARGIVAGNDPYLRLNQVSVETVSNDSVDTDSTGFIVNQVAATNINVAPATYIFLAIA